MPRVVPKRTAWSTAQEFRLVFDRLFASEGDVVLQQDAIGRIKVWLHRGQCPHAVESTAALMQLILRDAEPSTSHAAGAVSEHELRLSYSMAIIRFVNSLVDPLQTTYFARSIASLAAQIGLPPWFVELRHQATHEHLPSIAVLRDAARQAVDWLYANYWLPALNSAFATSTLAAALPPLPLSTLRPLLLTTYKSLSKQITRDASLAGKLKADVQKAYKDIERWIVENSLGGGMRGGKKEEEARERALEAVAEVLWEEGGLVPVAKKKRPTTRSPGLPTELRSLWTPLIAHFDHLYDGALSETITRKGLDMLCSGVTAPAAATTTTTSESTEQMPGAAAAASVPLDRTYAACVVAWVVELLRDAPLSAEPTATVGDDNPLDSFENDEDQDDSDGKDLTIKGVVRTCLLSKSIHAIPLIEALLASASESAGDTDTESAAALLSDRIEPLLPLLRAQAIAASAPNEEGSGGGALDFVRRIEGGEEAEAVLNEMEVRARQVEERLAIGGGGGRDGGRKGQASASQEDAEMQLDDEEEGRPDRDEASSPIGASGGGVSGAWERKQLWRKRPIGMLPKGGVLALDLAPLPTVMAAQ
ncbi:hypothetical protein BMF94_1411 [Rhodotorula taiwanensis]|uniref:Las1-domain-containing protein n=1 Tax=Rhodotorula taiwanensis TaxID=741276 RepID=A0A2S5BFF9_9BASI|nr:hypothetical protein BMF94_1411 [Rhodotorula taiwanensis]